MRRCRTDFVQPNPLKISRKPSVLEITNLIRSSSDAELTQALNVAAFLLSKSYLALSHNALSGINGFLKYVGLGGWRSLSIFLYRPEELRPVAYCRRLEAWHCFRSPSGNPRPSKLPVVVTVEKINLFRYEFLFVEVGYTISAAPRYFRCNMRLWESCVCRPICQAAV